MTTKKVTITMSRQEAIKRGLLTCKCGHPENNHFGFNKRPCARCDCNRYNEQAVVGKLEEP